MLRREATLHFWLGLRLGSCFEIGHIEEKDIEGSEHVTAWDKRPVYLVLVCGKGVNFIKLMLT